MNGRFRRSHDKHACREIAMLPMHTILHPTDFSETAEGAFPLACSLARDHGARLIVLHVYPPPLGHDEVIARRQPEAYEKPFWSALRRVRTDDAKIDIEHRLVEGDAAAEILRVAQEADCDLIVMGTLGRTGLPRLLMGSVAEKIVRRASCPVLTVKVPSPVASSALNTQRERTSSEE
jgi:universal stress protein A